ncbi:MAG TPA: endo-1,3-alpha-glucanase family glycosylhydrolase [Propionibacteriaceae bacterium]|nr:endo-1,3-alpha-glucanase family glycosylhydrolase [Propionibacteriaceae bacterium]
MTTLMFACLLLATALGCSSGGPPESDAEVPDHQLWFTKSTKESTRKYFAHYFGPSPRSADNLAPDYYTRNFLSASGEEGKHAAYGGFWRDRPLERPPISGDFRLQDAKWEISTAQAMGVDGFLVNILGLNDSSYKVYVTLVNAAVELDSRFKIVPMVDANGEAAAAATPEQWGAAMTYFIGKSSSYSLPDGRFLVASFAADKKAPSWWSDRLSAISSVNGVPVAFHAGLLNLSAIDAFAPIASFIGPWSYGADPAAIRSIWPQAAAIARASGSSWMGSVLTQNVRPSQATFDEAANSEALRASWSRVIYERADLVQAVTWNDFSEGGQLVPSVARGWGPAAMAAYYAEEWKTGVLPRILRDVVIVSHRDQPLEGASYQSRQTVLMTRKASDGATTPLRDEVEAITYLTAPAEVTVVVAGVTTSYVAPAGEHAMTFPIGTGLVSASVSRNGVEVAAVDSPFNISKTPVSQDRQYFFASSLDGTIGQHPLMTR